MIDQLSVESTDANVARHLSRMARERPDQIAVIAGAGRDRAGRTIYRRLSFAELNRVSSRYAWGLSGIGIGRGARVLLLVPAGAPLISITFALLKIGAVPILIDPAMGRRNLARCIAECAPEIMIGVPRAHLARIAFRRAFRTVRHSINAGSRFIPIGDVNLADLSVPLSTPFPDVPLREDDPAAILFTTGSTGVPKGVLYEHGMFEAQINLLRDLFGVEPGEIEMPAFPLFALFNVALGVTSAIPPIDPLRPAACDPATVIDFIQAQRVTSTFGSPAIWEKVTRYAIDHKVRLPTLRRVLMAGAPAPHELHERFRHILAPDADSHTPYGSTEALPVTSASGRELLAAHAERPNPTAGTCIGPVVPGMELRIIPISDGPIAVWDETLSLPPFEVGEICVSGPSVTKTYVNRPQSTALAKIAAGDTIWHRMGDLGYIDDQGRIWFYGRKSQRVATAAGSLYTEPVELVFNQHPDVFRSALVGIAGGPTAATPVVIVELQPGRQPADRAGRERLFAELREQGERYPMTAGITHFLIHPSFPVDIRHNAKIFREQLAIWAEREVGRRR